jgi:hypothetical protein
MNSGSSAAVKTAKADMIASTMIDSIIVTFWQV